MTDSSRCMVAEAVLFDVGNTLVHLNHERVSSVLLEAVGLRVSVGDLRLAGYVARAEIDRQLAMDSSQSIERQGIFMKSLLREVGVTDAMIPESIRRR